MKKLNVLLAAATAIALCTAAQADTQSQQRTVTVQYSLTEVATARGVRKLYSRLHAAALFVCGDVDGYPFPATMARFDICVRQALSRAITQIHQPALTAYAAARGAAAGSAPVDLARAR